MGWRAQINASFKACARQVRWLLGSLAGLRALERGFPRPGYDIRSGGRPVGKVTSGTMSPSLSEGIALGYVPSELAAEGTELEIDARGRPIRAVVTKTPFYDPDGEKLTFKAFTGSKA